MRSVAYQKHWLLMAVRPLNDLLDKQFLVYAPGFLKTKTMSLVQNDTAIQPASSRVRRNIHAYTQ